MTTTQVLRFEDKADIDAEAARLTAIIESHQDDPKWAAAIELATSRLDSLRFGGNGPLEIHF